MSVDPPAFRAAHAGGPDWRAAVAACAAELGADLPADGLGFVYLTDHWMDSLADVTEALRAATGVQHWVGTVGIGICATGKIYFDEPAVAAMVAPIPAEHFRLMPRLRDDLAPMRTAVGDWLSGHRPAVAFVHADPTNPALGEVLSDLAGDAGFVLGGLTAARGPSHPQLADRVSAGGISGVLFGPEAGVMSGLSQGCTPIGPVRTVTAADDDLLIEIDGRPALEVFKEDIGELLARDLRRVSGYIYCAFPISGSDTGDYLVRNLLALDPVNQVIAVAAHASVGDRLMFCRRDGASAAQDLERMLGGLRDRLPGPIRGGLYVSCVARGPNLFPEESHELALIRDVLGPFPLVGFFANGEISNDRLYGYTGVLTLFTGTA